MIAAHEREAQRGVAPAPIEKGGRHPRRMRLPRVKQIAQENEPGGIEAVDQRVEPVEIVARRSLRRRLAERAKCRRLAKMRVGDKQRARRHAPDGALRQQNQAAMLVRGDEAGAFSSATSFQALTFVRGALQLRNHALDARRERFITEALAHSLDHQRKGERRAAL